MRAGSKQTTIVPRPSQRGATRMSRLLGVSLIAASAGAFATSAALAKSAFEFGAPLLPLLAWRFTIAALAAWSIFLVRRNRRTHAKPQSRQVALLAVTGITYAALTGLSYAALQVVDLSLVVVIVFTYPVFVALVSTRTGRPVADRREWIALSAAIVGVSLTVGGIDATQAPPLHGLILAFATPILYAAWVVLTERLTLPPRIPGRGAASPVALARVGPALAVAVITSTTAAIFWAGVATFTPPGLPHPVIPLVIGIGVTAMIAMWTIYEGIRHIGAAQASIVSMVEPIIATAIAIVVLGETMTLVQLVGVGTLLLGIVGAQILEWRARGGSNEIIGI